MSSCESYSLRPTTNNNNNNNNNNNDNNKVNNNKDDNNNNDIGILALSPDTNVSSRCEWKPPK